MDNKGKKFIFSMKSTVRETSAYNDEKHQKQIFIDSDREVINFDKVKDTYVKECNLDLSDKPNSSDAILWENNDIIYLIEFKSGEIGFQEVFNINLKISNSVFLLMDILKEPLEFFREKVEYILVFDGEKHHRAKSYNAGKLEKNQVNCSVSRAMIQGKLNEKAKQEHIQFNLGRYKNFLYHNVHTYTKSQFMNFLHDH